MTAAEKPRITITLPDYPTVTGIKQFFEKPSLPREPFDLIIADVKTTAAAAWTASTRAAVTRDAFRRARAAVTAIENERHDAKRA